MSSTEAPFTGQYFEHAYGPNAEHRLVSIDIIQGETTRIEGDWANFREPATVTVNGELWLAVTDYLGSLYMQTDTAYRLSPAALPTAVTRIHLTRVRSG